jgi:hypothetical protein
MHEQHAVRCLQTKQVDFEHINRADCLIVTDQHLIQIRQHTDRDEQLQALRSVIPMGWPDCKEETALAVREDWPVKEELSVQK